VLRFSSDRLHRFLILRDFQTNVSNISVLSRPVNEGLGDMEGILPGYASRRSTRSTSALAMQ
jgi:hypothetical protein